MSISIVYFLRSPILTFCNLLPLSQLTVSLFSHESLPGLFSLDLLNLSWPYYLQTAYNFSPISHSGCSLEYQYKTGRGCMNYIWSGRWKIPEFPLLLLLPPLPGWSAGSVGWRGGRLNPSAENTELLMSSLEESISI